MYKLFRDKNDIFECKIELTGAKLSNAKARLILETADNLNLIFYGNINTDGNCQINIPRLQNIIDNNVENGKLKLEIIADDTFFNPWEDTVKIDTAKQIRAEVKQSILENTISPKVNVKVFSPNVKNLVHFLLQEGITKNKITSKKLIEILRKYPHKIDKETLAKAIDNIKRG